MQATERKTTMRKLIAFGFLAAAIAAIVAVAAAANPSGSNGRIVFARFDPARGDDFIYTANPDGSHEQQLLSTGAEGPRWSPDGSRIVVGPHDVDNVSARIVNPDDGSYRDVPNPNPDLFFLPCNGPWSPDGRRLTFTRAAWLYAADARGANARRVDHGVYASWAPDGRRLAYLHWQCDSCARYLAVANVVTGRRNGILRGIDPSGVAWSADGTRIAFDTCCHDRPDGTSFNTIDTVSPSGGGRRTVVTTETDVYNLAWSRDGRFAFDDQAELYVAAPSTRAHKLFRGGADYGPIWTPDGRRILFTRTGSGLYSMTARGAGLRRVLRAGIETLSPDGRRYAFSNDADGIDVGTFAGKVVYYRALQDDGAGDTSKWDPAFARNNRELAYLDGTPDADGTVSVLTLATGKGRGLGVTADGDLEWSPDGRQLAFRSAGSLYAFDLRAHRRRLLARDASQPAWSPDGRRIAFVRQLGSNSEIYVMRADGSDERRITNNPGDDQSPSWQPLR
jgi:Tol biopolymer transport system component